MTMSRAFVRAACALSTLLASAGTATAGGPDVIVGDVSNAATFGSQSVGGMTRYSYCLGTTSCNIGNQNLLWIASTNQHPVIGQNVYRLKNGRMEQIGLSWLKNGFTALTQNLCSTCNGQGGAVLGVGCSDPYSGTLNGEQSRLGPRSWVNPSSGYYLYNPSGWPAAASGEATINRRLQILDADIDPALNVGAVYFGETQYITPDDGGAGNGWNNVSYRPMTFGTTSARTAGVSGSTVRTKCALEAWAAADSTVSVFPLDVPGDGRLFVACRVSDNGNGTWHYEYAVENITSDRAGGSFIIPLPAGATVTNAESRNPFYHSGEPYDNRPFLPTITSGAVTFLPQELGTITGTAPGAGEAPWATTGVKATVKNAVRWGTTYNFRFDCTAAPALGSGKLGFDKPGTGAFTSLNDVAFSIKTPGGAASTPVVFNDDCASPGTLHDGPNGWNSLGATSSAFGACADGGSSAIDNDLWFKYTYPTGGCDGTITFTTCGSDFAAKIAVYSACPTGAGSEIACAAGNLTSCGSGPAQASVSVATPTGTNRDLLVRIGSATGATGNLVINVVSPTCLGACCAPSGTCSVISSTECSTAGGTFRGDGVTCPPTPACPTPPPPANDACANAQWLADSVAVTGATNQATFVSTDVSGAGCSSSTSKDVWFKYRPTAATSPTSVNVNTCSSSFDTVLNVFTGACGTLTQVWCNDDNNGGSGSTLGNGACGGGNNSGLNYNMVTGTTYLIRVAGYNGAVGSYRVVAIGGGGAIPPAPPANDACAAATTVTDGSTAFTTAGATTDGTAPTCSGIASGNIDNDAWFSYTAPITGRLTASTCSSSFNTRMAIYSGATCTGFDARLLGCNDDFACPVGGATQSSISLDVTQGAVYLIRVGGTSGASGAGTLSVSTAPQEGACCTGTTCSISTAAACPGGFKGVNTVCEFVNNPTTCCKANFNQTAGVTIDDLFLYFNAYFMSEPSADINGVGGTTIDDLFVYINLWFVGC